MSNLNAQVPKDAADAEYARFGYRELDKMSWLGPLVNNRIGRLLRIQLRHEHLFFVTGDRIVAEIGYGEKSHRFHERDMGKPIENFADLTSAGYWLFGPKLNASSAVAALDQVKDGSYYSVFSNQCQDWAHRVRRRSLRIMKERGIPQPAPEPGSTPEPERRVSPTVPAASYFGMIAIAVAILGLAAPINAGLRYLQFVGALLAIIGISDIVYAIRSGEWSSCLSTVFFGLLSLAGGAVLIANRYVFLEYSNGIMAAVFAVAGVARVGVALRSRPLSAWWGTLATGLLFLASAPVAWYHRDGAAGAWLLGVMLSLSFLAAGISTIWLNRKLAQSAA